MSIENNHSTMSVSWSEMTKFLSCQRSHELAYRENLQKKFSTAHRGRIFGTVVHTGIAKALEVFTEHTFTDSSLIDWAIRAATSELDDLLGQNIEPNVIQMFEDIRVQVSKLLAYLIPRIGLGTQYRVVAVPKELQEYSLQPNDYFIEWEWEFEGFRGIVDAVLENIETGEICIVDWKTRHTMPYPELANVDGQLMFYASILNLMGLPVTNTIMWQFRRDVPKPAVLKKDGTPSIASQTTTWEYWLETLPAPMQERMTEGSPAYKKWYELLVESGKVKTELDFVHPVDVPVTDGSRYLAMNNAMTVAAQIEQAYQDGKPSPALMSSMGCKFCDFLVLCANGLKHGGDVQPILDELYEARETEFTDEVTDID